jgi:hypothetical protein
LLCSERPLLALAPEHQVESSDDEHCPHDPARIAEMNHANIFLLLLLIMSMDGESKKKDMDGS